MGRHHRPFAVDPGSPRDDFSGNPKAQGGRYKNRDDQARNLRDTAHPESMLDGLARRIRQAATDRAAEAESAGFRGQGQTLHSGSRRRKKAVAGAADTSGRNGPFWITDWFA